MEVTGRADCGSRDAGTLFLVEPALLTQTRPGHLAEVLALRGLQLVGDRARPQRLFAKLVGKTGASRAAYWVGLACTFALRLTRGEEARIAGFALRRRDRRQERNQTE